MILPCGVPVRIDAAIKGLLGIVVAFTGADGSRDRRKFGHWNSRMCQYARQYCPQNSGELRATTMRHLGNGKGNKLLKVLV